MNPPEPRRDVRPGRSGGSQTGAALLAVVSVLTVLAIVVSIVMERSRGDIRPWARQTDMAQALYAAESGIAYQLYLERFSDSSEPSFGAPRPADSSGDAFTAPKAPTDTFAFRMDTSLGVPAVHVDRTRAFLDIASQGNYRNAQATVIARFGRALDDSIFGPALTLDNVEPLEPYPAGNIVGAVRLRAPAPGQPALPWPPGFSIESYGAEFTDRKYYALESVLQKKLGEEGGITGNGSFSPEAPPRFGKSGDLVFPLGGAELVNGGEEPWTLKGPGRIICDGEIRVRGRIRLQNIQLLSGKDITFQDSVTGEDISVFARRSIFFQDNCKLAIEALAGKDIVLRDRSQTLAGSVLLTVADKNRAKGPDSLNAIRIVNQAVARGFLIAGGPKGRVVLGTRANVVEGVVMAAAVWLAGEVRGPVLTRKLLCEGTNARNCLGPGRIDRDRLPSGFVQPLQLGPQDRRQYAFKLMEWKRR